MLLVFDVKVNLVQALRVFNVGRGRRPVGGRRRTRIRSEIAKITQPRARPESSGSWRRPPRAKPGGEARQSAPHNGLDGGEPRSQFAKRPTPPGGSDPPKEREETTQNDRRGIDSDAARAARARRSVLASPTTYPGARRLTLRLTIGADDSKTGYFCRCGGPRRISPGSRRRVSQLKPDPSTYRR